MTKQKFGKITAAYFVIQFQTPLHFEEDCVILVLVAMQKQT